MNEWCISPEEVQIETEVLKEGQVFVTALPTGEIPGELPGELGLYFCDTRFLSRFEMRIQGTRPVFLSSITRDSHFAQVELTNRELVLDNGITVPLQTLHLRVMRMVKDALLQRLRFINFNPFPVTISLELNFSADYADIFEVRGYKRNRRGEVLPPLRRRNGFIFGYKGLDGVKRFTRVSFSPPPWQLELKEAEAAARFVLELKPQKKYHLYIEITPYIQETEAEHPPQPVRIASLFVKAAKYHERNYRKWKEKCTSFESDNALFNQMLQHNITDLRALFTHYPNGSIIEAGIPWYAAPFGRDSLITAWQTLMINPDIARHTLRFLARYQGREENAWRDESPGKILHEIRFGEMARCGEIPHTPYYGSVDSTLWFVIVLGELIRWTNDLDFLREMEGPLRGCLKWCQDYGDMDGDGYIEYLCRSPQGLTNQGWKDSWDGVVDRWGNIPQGPVALVEVQAYYYLALIRAAELLEKLGDAAEAQELRRRAEALRERFIEDFWLKEEDFMVFALDGKKNPVICTVSNPGQCLFTGILPPDKARKVAARLFQPDMFSGWGIRTMGKNEGPYNPMSYHNGSVWPHDNAIIAQGLREYDFTPLLLNLFQALYEAALTFPYFRLPELFCGFTRRGMAGPVHYPIACDPQAWAVGSIFQLLRALLGIRCVGGDVYVSKPFLPPAVNELRIRNMAVGNGWVDLEFARRHNTTYCNMLSVEGGARVIFEP